MALQGTQRTSRLSQMQMRFQQKQQVERDQKKLDMLGTTTRTFGKMSLTTPPGGATDDAKLLTSSLGGGKVRQMFEERRERGERIGIDKAYPLKPISGNTERIIPRTEPPPSVTQTVTKKKVPTPVLNAVGRVNTTTTSDFNSRSSVDPLNNTVVMPKYNSTNRVPSLKSNGITNNNHIIPATPSPLKPVSAKFTAPSALMPETRKPIVTPPQVKTAAVSPVKKATPVANVPPAEGMEQCSICGRNFLEERIAKHETICKKTAVKKRKIFDSTKHRVQGTEAEVYVKKATKTKVKPVPEKVSAKKGNWRKKHEEFIAAIRAAKEMQAYLAKGGSLKDLPPPPPSENPDYIQCPHCSRRFNQAAAERHIPKCATMLHNKPKPKPSVVKKR